VLLKVFDGIFNAFLKKTSKNICKNVLKRLKIVAKKRKNVFYIYGPWRY